MNAGVDSEMTSTLIRDFGEELLAKGEISMSRINDAVRRILRVKMRAGLFEQCAHLRPFEADGCAFRIVLVVEVRFGRSRDDRVELTLECLGPRGDARSFGFYSPASVLRVHTHQRRRVAVDETPRYVNREKR